MADGGAEVVSLGLTVVGGWEGSVLNLQSL